MNKVLQPYVCKVESFGGLTTDPEQGVMMVCGYDVLHKSARVDSKPMRVQQGVRIPRPDSYPDRKFEEEGRDQLYNGVSANIVALSRALIFIDRDRKGGVLIKTGNPQVRQLLTRRHWWNRWVSIRQAPNEHTRIVLRMVFDQLKGIEYHVSPAFPELGERVVNRMMKGEVKSGQVVMSHE